MSRKRNKQNTLQRAQGVGKPSGSIVLPSHVIQQMLLQQHYNQMTQIKNKGGQGDALFTPGIPLETQPGTAPSGQPISWRFPLAWNTMGVDRSLGLPDRPSFEQLRSLAELCDAICLCERAWYDMVPRMDIKISLKPDLIAQGADERKYQKQISYFKNWMEHPGYNKQEDIHTWLRRALREQSQIDELYVHKHQNKGGGLYSLDVLAGDIMKPLLDDWGRIPIPPLPAYQEYPWGIPGLQFTTDDMIHYQESPAANRPYGFSRVERVIMRVNQLLRKQNRDLAMFTEGNIPAAIGEVPSDTQWTPDQIDAFEQAWNALIAGSPQQQVRVRFTMPGMKITKLDNGEIMTDFDLFLIRMTVGCYGLGMNDLAFSDNANYSTADAQENVTYRRTIGPLATIYARLLTNVMQNDFDPDLQGEMFQLTFSGFEEESDLQAQSTAYSTLTGAGILGISDAAKLMNLPIPKDAPYIGRIIISKDGPMFLDDMASDEMRNAAKDAKMAGFELAANPSAPGQNEATQTPTQGKATNQNTASKQTTQDDEEVPQKPAPKTPARKDTAQKRYTLAEIERLLTVLTDQQSDEEDTFDEKSPFTPEESTRITEDLRGGGSQVATRATATALIEHVDSVETGQETHRDYRRWRSRALDDVKAGRALRGFTTTFIPEYIHSKISHALTRCTSPEHVRLVFTRVTDTAAQEPELEYYPELDAWQPKTLYQQIEEMKARGVKYLKWAAHPGCDLCSMNDGEQREPGKPFSNHALLPGLHPHCQCTVQEIHEEVHA